MFPGETPMPTDYDKIREDNIREYGQGTRHLSFLGRLYTDRTHFVFELLQNAEDAGATRILFSLFDDRLEVTHDGRLFNERDVRGVCGVGEGTKTEDLTQIGKFGIGFKSVYAYTATPEVHSGGEGFRIENYVRPYAVPPKPAGNSWTTLFVFPFNTAEISPETACKEIGARLRNLSARTLLFLRKINEIEYKLPSSTGGVYLREEIARGPGRQVSVIGQNNGKDEEENWLIFERLVPVPGNSETVRVEVSFRMEAEDKAGKNSERIVKVKDSPLVVYFPTEKATRFGFLIQGPYRTTPSRDNIPKDDEWNETLVKETAELIGDILSEIKDLGLLSVSFLEALPIRTEDYPDDSMFYPIVESVRNTLIKDELLPADDGSFVSAGNAKLARGADLRKLLGQVQLGQLFQSPATMKWLAGEITQDRTPDLRSYLISELDVEEVTPDGLARRISYSFLSGQPDEWFVDFYGYLSGQEALWRAPRWERDPSGILRSKPILRIANGSQEAPFKPDGTNPNAFLPPPEETAFPVVSRSIVTDEQARTFLKRLGLSEPDVFDDIVERVLPKYTKPGGDSVPDTEHQADIHKIVRAMGSDSEAGKRKVIQAARRTPFLKATNPSGDTLFKKPAEVYLNTAELRRYFSSAQEVWFLHDEYTSSDIGIDVWHDLGVSDLPRVIRSKTNIGYSSMVVSEGHSHSIENNDLDGLENSLEQLSHLSTFGEQLDQCTLIWKILVRVLEEIPGLFRAEYKWHHYRWKSRYIDSKVISLLRLSAWIPTQEGTLEKPGEITTDQLLEEFLGATELIESLGIVEGADQSEDERKREHATELGVSLEDIEFLKNHRDEVEQLKAALASRKERPTFPTRPVANPERRQERLGEQLSDAPDKEYEKKERSVQVPTEITDEVIKTWLRNQYMNDDDQMVCQICKMEHFRKRNGEHHFEKKEVLTSKFLPKKLVAQYLALCPLCAAKYDEFVKTDDDVMAELREEIVSAKECEIPISLGDERTSIRFVETHYHDLKAIIEGVE
jgi:hypothetical protein